VVFPPGHGENLFDRAGPGTQTLFLFFFFFSMIALFFRRGRNGCLLLVGYFFFTCTSSLRGLVPLLRTLSKVSQKETHFHDRIKWESVGAITGAFFPFFRLFFLLPRSGVCKNRWPCYSLFLIVTPPFTPSLVLERCWFPPFFLPKEFWDPFCAVFVWW